MYWRFLREKSTVLCGECCCKETLSPHIVGSMSKKFIMLFHTRTRTKVCCCFFWMIFFNFVKSRFLRLETMRPSSPDKHHSVKFVQFIDITPDSSMYKTPHFKIPKTPAIVGSAILHPPQNRFIFAKGGGTLSFPPKGLHSARHPKAKNRIQGSGTNVSDIFQKSLRFETSTQKPC